MGFLPVLGPKNPTTKLVAGFDDRSSYLQNF